MVGKNVQTEMLLELVFSANGEINELLILKKSIPLYLRKLNCFQAGVLRDTGDDLEESLLIPVVASKSKEWEEVKSHFTSLEWESDEPCSQIISHGSYFYAYRLNKYGVLILGRKKPFDETFIYELEPIINHLGMVLIQAKEIEQRKKAERSLKESEQRLRILSDSTTAGIVIYNNDKIIYANPAAEKLSGYFLSELVKLSILDLVHNDFKLHFTKQGFITNQTLGLSPNFEMKILRKDGEECWLDITIGLIDWMGETTHIISAFDTTRRRQEQEDLIKAKEKAEESDRLKSAFLSNMSHEIRTPMNGILGFAELLKEPNLTAEEHHDFIRTIEKSGARMLSTLNDIIDISKIESGMMQVDISESNINTQMEFVYKFFKPEVEAKGMKLSYNNGLSSEQALVLTDIEKVYALLTNLVKNAIKFTDKGSIEFGYTKKGEFLEFFVKDTGVGISPKLKDQIFERFRQGSESLDRSYEGSGLGLSICKSYAEMLDGKIWVVTEEKIGSTFYFTIAYNPVVIEKTRTVNASIPENTEIQYNKIRILIAEDDETSFSFLAILLKRVSNQILHAKTGVEAVKICRENPDIDLILMDIKMPELDGYEATRQIRKFNNNVIIIAQTAYALSGDGEHAINSGCNNYIPKPIHREELMRLVKEYFNK
jgi:PAS domain S-box-containing protein